LVTIGEKLKKAIREPGYLKTLFFASAVVPTNPGRVIVEEGAAGLTLLHTAATPAEAEMLRQLLRDGGFYVEYVPSASTGIFGTANSSSIYVKPEEYQDANAFVTQFYSSNSTIGDEVD
jgi:hypothetical protein